MYYTIYKITNQIDGKIYVGSHKTKDLNDDYMGSGKYLKRAIKKYGIENFTKDTLFVFDNSEDMYAKEAEIVNEDFLVTENTYNLKIGGFGGWDHLNDGSEEHRKRCKDGRSKRKMYKPGAFIDAEYQKLCSKKGKLALKEKYPNGTFYGKNHTEEHKQRMSDVMKLKTVGKLNSQFGTMWITNGIVNKKIKKTDTLPTGWCRGRKYF